MLYFFSVLFLNPGKASPGAWNFIPVALYGRAVATLKIAIVSKSRCSQRCKFMLNYFEDSKLKKQSALENITYEVFG